VTATGSCPGCNGHCCSVYRVGVNGNDTQRIARSLLLPVESFAGLMPVDPGARGAVRLDDSEQHWALELHHRDSGPCVLLVELLDGTGRCGVYEHRPGSCRVYPATYDGERTLMREDAMCLARGGCGFADRPLQEWTALLYDTEWEWAVYQAALSGWDIWRDGPTTPQTFLGWLAETYRRLDDIAPEDRLEHAAAIGAAI
jgi:Fe-S-cluster containining protein